ncbi:MAG: sugar transferase [bacterium]
MYKYFLKRLIDIVFSLIAIIVLSPILIPVSILLLLTGEHEILYLQKRIGYKKKPFYIWKFATMLKNSPNMGTGSLTLRNDPRVTPVGRVLRKTKINELPQLFNILKGDMSLVGPRPLMEFDFIKYPKEIQEKVYNVKPGLTGVASIVFRDKEKYFSGTTMDPHEFDRKYIAPYKGRLEEWYQRNLSFITDMKIIYYTILVVFDFKGNYNFNALKKLPDKPDFID